MRLKSPVIADLQRQPLPEDSPSCSPFLLAPSQGFAFHLPWSWTLVMMVFFRSFYDASSFNPRGDVYQPRNCQQDKRSSIPLVPWQRDQAIPRRNLSRSNPDTWVCQQLFSPCSSNYAGIPSYVEPFALTWQIFRGACGL